MKLMHKLYTRRHLELYSEIAFSKILLKKKMLPYFPFKDVGIDMIALKRDKMEFYQIKARNEETNLPSFYWFSLKKNLNQLHPFPKNKTYFILCALQPNQKDFHFFKIPYPVVQKYFKTITEKDANFLQIKRLENNKYELRPKIVNVKINLNKYRIN